MNKIYCPKLEVILRKWALVFCIFAFYQTLYAQEKHDLVIGNGDYTALGKLKNPVNDAEDLVAVLNDLGFNVLVKSPVLEKRPCMGLEIY
jgi:hypothetical protein